MQESVPAERRPAGLGAWDPTGARQARLVEAEALPQAGGASWPVDVLAAVRALLPAL